MVLAILVETTSPIFSFLCCPVSSAIVNPSRRPVLGRAALCKSEPGASSGCAPSSNRRYVPSTSGNAAGTVVPVLHWLATSTRARRDLSLLALSSLLLHLLTRNELGAHRQLMGRQAHGRLGHFPRHPFHLKQ